MVDQINLYTVEDFDQFIALPENADRRFEFIDGEIIEAPSNPFSSEIAILIAAALLSFVKPRRLGRITGEGAGYIVAGRRISPDVAFVAASRQDQLVQTGYNPVAPDLAVEVVAPTDRHPAIRRKLAIYAEAGVLVWLVYPTRRLVEVYAPDQPVQIVTADGMLDGGSLLPGFRLSASEIFPD
ncbi:MAG: Uma2 family endonuclease [Anaerolineae bacterium]|nr:Uma2 family endonuclease [Anaerolineae bacterium]